jgi:hypothetical protein
MRVSKQSPAPDRQPADPAGGPGEPVGFFIGRIASGEDFEPTFAE